MQIHGKGTYRAANGDVFQCRFENEARTGLGTCVRPFRPVEHQYWRHGSLVVSTNLPEIVIMIAILIFTLYFLRN